MRFLRWLCPKDSRHDAELAAAIRANTEKIRSITASLSGEAKATKEKA